ncbi:unnamed protein product [Lepeophtheirus salmonis]|uniref:(salmon louse) hypothetical protein n=1 Tax=Lepeophtheirus salmonis TaxID=72036 RepID=A0A7R8HCC1_LEPSM|nr:unnamed protein product [Lepeophtheirus salmonis]CAF3012083.1 unnamed protein product [Lepeophtheirus salmonis]
MMATNLEIGDPENSHHHHHSSDNDSIHVVKIVNAKKASKIQDKPSAIQNVMDFSNNNRNLDRYSFTCWKCGIGFNVCCDFESHNRAMHPMSEDPNCSSTAEGPSVAKQISSHCTNPVLVKPSTQEQIKPPLKASSPVTNKPCSNKELMNIPPRLDMTVLPTDRNSPSSEPAKPPSSPRITLKQIQSSPSLMGPCNLIASAQHILMNKAHDQLDHQTHSPLLAHASLPKEFLPLGNRA